MTYTQAWNRIFEAWHCRQWQPIPQDVRLIIPFHPLLGMYRGSLVTRAGAAGTAEFIDRMNARMA